MNKMFYLISREFEGRYFKADGKYYDITTKPGRDWSTNKIKAYGNLGTQNEWTRHAHGAFESYSVALTALDQITKKEYRVVNPRGYPDFDSSIWLRALDGLHEKISAEATSLFAHKRIQCETDLDMTAEDTRDLIADIVYDCEFDRNRTPCAARIHADILQRQHELAAAEIQAS